MEVPDSALMDRAVLVIWHGGTTPEVMQPLVEGLRAIVGEKGKVSLENIERLETFPQQESSVDVILSGFFPPPSLSHSASILAELARLLKPSGALFLREPVTTVDAISGLCPVKKLTSALKLSGFVDVSEAEMIDGLNSDLKAGLQARGINDEEMVTVSLAHVQAKKPSYEVGASSRLSFASKIQPPQKVSSETAKVWSIATLDAMDDDIELVDSDTLLEEDDLLKPDPASLRSNCGPNSGRRKACKDCTCGMAEELEKGGEVKPRSVTSSCGNCYLGDAFRCASCPYFGMPAFKPGDQIRLSNRQLKADQ